VSVEAGVVMEERAPVAARLALKRENRRLRALVRRWERRFVALTIAWVVSSAQLPLLFFGFDIAGGIAAAAGALGVVLLLAVWGRL
jgi:uncharacterized membrane protein YjjP (DUF1212 family)